VSTTEAKIASPKRRLGDVVFANLTRGAGLIILIALAGVAIFLTVEGAPAFKAGPDDLSGAANFMAYDRSYTGGVSLTTGWVAGVEGGAKSVVTGQLDGPGTVRAWSTGSRLNGFPAMYTASPNHHDVDVKFAQIASFVPFVGGSGVTVATTSTTSGADLLVSGTDAGRAVVRKLALARPDPTATTVAPTVVGTLPALTGFDGPAPLGGR